MHLMTDATIFAESILKTITLITIQDYNTVLNTKCGIKFHIDAQLFQYFLTQITLSVLLSALKSVKSLSEALKQQIFRGKLFHHKKLYNI